MQAFQVVACAALPPIWGPRKGKRNIVIIYSSLSSECLLAKSNGAFYVVGPWLLPVFWENRQNWGLRLWSTSNKYSEDIAVLRWFYWGILSGWPVDMYDVLETLTCWMIHILQMGYLPASWQPLSHAFRKPITDDNHFLSHFYISLYIQKMSSVLFDLKGAFYLVDPSIFAMFWMPSIIGWSIQNGCLAQITTPTITPIQETHHWW